MKSPRSFRYAESDGVARMTLSRPETLNSLTLEVYRELIETFRALADRPKVRAVVLTGEGRAFCTGGDVRFLIKDLLDARPRERLKFTRMSCDLVRAMRSLPRPIVAALNGIVAGAGAAIALASDVRIAAETVKIAFLFVKVGLSGADMGVAHLLPRVVGLGRAAELLMTGDFIDAAEGLRIGLFNRVVPGPRLAAETGALVDRLVRGPAAGIAATKKALHREMHMDLEAALEEEARIQAILTGGADFREGYEAFLAKRPPRFQGAPR